MKHGWIVMCLALLGLTLVAISLVSPSVAAIEPARLTKSYVVENDLHVSEKFVTWTEPTPTGQDLYAYNIQTRTTTDIGPMTGQTDLYYDKLVWLDNSNGNIYLVNLSVSNNPVLETKMSNFYSPIGVWDNYIVYSNYTWSGPNYYLDVYKWDIKQGVQIPIWLHQTPGSPWVQGIDVTNNRVIIYFTDNNNNLAWMDISPSSGVQMVQIPGSSYCYLAGNTNDLVACSGYNGNFILSLQSQTISPLPIGTPMMGSTTFTFQGNNILFTNISSIGGFNYDLFMYNLNTKITMQITSSTAMDLYGAFYGDKIAYISNRDGFFDVYFMVVPNNPPDFVVHSWDISVNPTNPVVNEPAKVLVTVYNQGQSFGAANVTMSFKKIQDPGNGKFMTQFMDPIGPGTSKVLEFKDVNFFTTGQMDISIDVQWSPSPGNPPEFKTDNNDAMTTVLVVDRPAVSIVMSPSTNINSLQNVSFDGKSGTTDRDGIMLWIWNFGDGTTSLGPYINHSWATPGKYLVNLTVYDIYGTQATGSVNVVVNDLLPVAVCSVPPVAARNTTIVLSAAGSYDPDGSIVEAYWVVDNNAPLNGLVVSTSLSSPNQTVEAILHLTDNYGKEARETKFLITLVDAKAHNVPPVAVIQVTGNGLNVTFSGLSSYDPNGKVVSYLWTFSDNSTASGSMVNKSFKTGTYIATLLVKDNENLEGTTTASFTLSYTAPPTIINKVNQTVINQVKGNLPPKASASFNQTGTKGVVNFHGAASDTDGTIVKYEWDFNGDGTWDYTSTTNPDASYTYTSPGYYMALFRATDNNGTSIVVPLAIGVNTKDIGAHGNVSSSSVGMSSIVLILIICIVAAIAIAAGVGYVMSKKVAMVQKDMAAEQEVAEIKKLVEESKTTGANVDEAEALIKQFEGK